MFCRLLAIWIWGLGFPLFLFGFQVNDPIFLKVDTGKNVFLTDVETSKKNLLDHMKAQIKKAAETGNLELVQKLINQKREFEVYPEKIPQAEEYRLFVDAYQEKIQEARSDLVKVYKEAVVQYTKKLEIEKAESMKRELDGFLQLADAKVVNNNPLKNAQKIKNDIQKAMGIKKKFDFDGTWICRHPKNRWVGKRVVDGDSVIDVNGTICKWNQVGAQITVIWPNKSWEKLNVDNLNFNKLMGRTSRGLVTIWERDGN